MTIGELAKLAKTTTVAIRHYEKMGLLNPMRSKGGYRQYDLNMVRKMKFIENAKFLGFTLAEIAELFKLEDKDLSSGEVKQRVQHKLVKLKQKISLLRCLQENLRALDRLCDGLSPTSSCPIMQNLYVLEPFTVKEQYDECECAK